MEKLQKVQSFCSKGENYYTQVEQFESEMYSFLTSNRNSEKIQRQMTLKSAVFQFLNSNFYIVQSNPGSLERDSEKTDKSARGYFERANFNALRSLRIGNEKDNEAFIKLGNEKYEKLKELTEIDFFSKIIFSFFLFIFLFLLAKKMNNSKLNVMSMFAVLSLKQLDVLIERLKNFREENLSEFIIIGSLEKIHQTDNSEEEDFVEEGSSDEEESRKIDSIDVLNNKKSLDNFSENLKIELKKKRNDLRKPSVFSPQSFKRNLNKQETEFKLAGKVMSLAIKSKLYGKKSKRIFKKSNFKTLKNQQIENLKRSNSLKSVSQSVGESCRFGHSKTKDDILVQERMERLSRVKLNQDTLILKNLIFLTILYISWTFLINYFETELEETQKYSFDFQNSLTQAEHDLKMTFNFMQESLLADSVPLKIESKFFL